jgi:cell division septal protein FtsQ
VVGMRGRRALIMAGVVLLALYGLGRLVAVEKITVTAPSHRAEIETQTRKLIAATWRQGNLVTLDSRELESDLAASDPLLRDVEVKRRWLHTVMVTVALKQPSIGWSTGNQVFLLDRDGTVIGAFPAGSTLPVVTDGSNLPVEVGKRVTTARFTDFVTGVQKALTDAKVGVTGLSVGETTLDLTVQTNRGYRLVFDTGRGVNEEMADYKAVANLLASQKKTPAEYIDLRVAGKAYYK